MQKSPITLQGITSLREELDKLKKNDRPNVIAAIAEARAHGDLKENAEYHAAREQQGFIEGRIKELESIAASAQIIDLATLNPGDKIVFGATVGLLNLNNDDEVTYQFVGEYEANVEQNKISITSPIARALIGHATGDSVTVKTPEGEVEFEILSIDYIV